MERTPKKKKKNKKKIIKKIKKNPQKTTTINTKKPHNRYLMGTDFTLTTRQPETGLNWTILGSGANQTGSCV